MSPGDAATTFLITDIEDSSGLWERNPDGMRSALAEHDRVFRQAITAHGGEVVKSLGDGFLATFSNPSSALRAVLDALREIRAESGPGALADGQHVRMRVRAAVHAGPAEHRDGDYFGHTLNLLSRMLQAARGARILLSAAVAGHVELGPSGASLLDHGLHRLRGLSIPERLFQVVHPDVACETGPLLHLEPVHPNLPAPVSSFIGREREGDLLIRQLEQSRLVTLIGAGGTGKTRLAIRVAGDLHPRLRDGAWFVNLAPVTDPAFIPAAVAEALRVRERGSQPLADTLSEFVAERSLLLVVDNCEHLLDGVANLVQRLLSVGPGVRVLATSREPLDLPGERLHTLQPLGVPAGKTVEPVARLLEYDAVALFVERSRLRGEDFELTPENAPAVIDICRRLDGLPLAIELAAARLRHLTVEQIAAGLNDALSLLTSRMRGLEPRQQTLRGLIDWSYGLLTPPEKILLRRLAAFAGGFTLEATAHVCAGAAPEGALETAEVPEVLHRLCDRSLVVDPAVGGHPGAGRRYHLLETVRQYCRSRVEEAGEDREALARHGEWFLKLVQDADGELQGANQQQWLERLQAEHGNLRAALHWAVGAATEENTEAATERAFRLAVGLWRFWWMRGHLAEGRTWLERVLQLPDPVSPRLRARAGTGAGSLAWFQGDYTGAEAHHQRALEIWSRLEDAPGVASSTSNLAMVAYAQGDLARALALFRQAAEAYRTLDQPLHLAQCLCNVGKTAALLAHYELAREVLEESVALFRSLGDQVGEANALHNQAHVAVAEGDTGQAGQLHLQALRLRIRMADVLGQSSSLEGIAHLLSRLGEPRLAALLIGASDARRREVGATLSGPDLQAYDDLLDLLKRELSTAELEDCLLQGAAEPSVEALEEAIRGVLDKQAGNTK